MVRTTLLALLAAAALPGSAAGQYIGGGAPPPPPPPAAGTPETPEAALARNIRILAGSPRNYDALVGAGQAALDLGDAQAAAGFFGRAEEVHPTSWVPKIGQGAALVHLLEPQAALRAFEQAQRLGATQASVALERGLAFDLLGDQARAQSDYRVALNGIDGAEARRRLALSLGISGRKAEALAILDPLLARRDPGAIRTRALVLALSGDAAGARTAVTVVAPGMAASMDPFFRQLPSLRPNEKAAAVHFGQLPGDDQSSPAYGSYASTVPVGPRPDRMAEIEQLLKASPSVSTSSAATPAITQPVPPPPAAQLAIAQPVVARAAPAPRRYWVQLASGQSAAALADQFRRIKSRNSELLDGISGYVAEEPSKARLLIGPFRDADDARIFADDLETARVDAFPWTSAQGQAVRKLP
ncbi:tetratricopeptide repeat protein [Sphingomonas arenae]|uniref:tetratricopeptide repeat protein n=1 Tax=Sphingomonas arenae TaxID=2812555 RepID=UPI00196879F5|nr:tetratricopeptide repeat protein [Sphingomonas arenae]